MEKLLKAIKLLPEPQRSYYLTVVRDLIARKQAKGLAEVFDTLATTRAIEGDEVIKEELSTIKSTGEERLKKLQRDIDKELSTVQTSVEEVVESKTAIKKQIKTTKDKLTKKIDKNEALAKKRIEDTNKVLKSVQHRTDQALGTLFLKAEAIADKSEKAIKGIKPHKKVEVVGGKNVTVTKEELKTKTKYIVNSEGENKLTVIPQGLSKGAADKYYIHDDLNTVKDYHIDWGLGTDQVSAVDLPIADAGDYYTGEEVEAALQEIGAGTTLDPRYVKQDGTTPLTANWDAGAFSITAETLISDVATGTAPFIVASETMVDNLNADLLDGQEGAYYLDSDNLTGTSATNWDTAYTHIGENGASHTYINQSVTDVASPTFVTAKLTGLTDGYLPYHVDDATGLANSPIFTDGTNVGIGTTDPGELFEVYGDTKNIRINNTAETESGIIFTDSGSVTVQFASILFDSGSTAGGTANTLNFYTSSATSRMTIDNIGNVGIGTTDPGEQVEVYGATPNIEISNTAETESGILFTDSHAPAYQYAKILFDSGATAGGTANTLNFYTSSATSRMTIDNIGNVGIGTTNPGNKLDIVTGSTTSSEFHMGENVNEGMYMLSSTDNNCWISGGVEHVSGSWTARSTAASAIGLRGGDILLRGDTGLTDGATYTPTTLFRAYGATGYVEINNRLQRAGDPDTFLNFATDKVSIFAGGQEMMEFTEAATDQIVFNKQMTNLDGTVDGWLYIANTTADRPCIYLRQTAGSNTDEFIEFQSSAASGDNTKTLVEYADRGTATPLAYARMRVVDNGGQFSSGSFYVLGYRLT